MMIWWRHWKGPATVIMVAMAAATLDTTPVTAQKPKLSVERLAALPSLIGTAPVGPVWSPDSRSVAFLWNDQAMPFREIWVAEASGRPPRKLTDVAHETRRPTASATTAPAQDDFATVVEHFDRYLGPGPSGGSR